MKLQFRRGYVPARKTLVDFVQEHYQGNVLDEIGKDPDRWLEELNMISNMLTGLSIGGVTGMDLPPLDDPEFKEIGNDVFYYPGSQGRLRGIWLCKDVPDYTNGFDTDETRTEWTRYSLGGRALVFINEEFPDLAPENLMPENFEPRAQLVQDKKRPIYRVPLRLDRQNSVEEMVYAKGAAVSPRMYFDSSRPSFRLTNLSGIYRVSSEKELKMSVELAEAGIRTPDIVGRYMSDVEEFLFVREVKGKRPDACFQKHRDEIIRQDAVMLARLCRLGYRKQGYEDFDDKVFDGKDLYMIDVEDLVDLYSHLDIDFRKVLLDPSSGNVRMFRRYQRDFFRQMLKDAVYEYRDTLLVDESHKKAFIKHFFDEMGWKQTEKQTASLLDFGDNYLTYNRHMAIMLDTD